MTKLGLLNRPFCDLAGARGHQVAKLAKNCQFGEQVWLKILKIA